MEAFGTAQLSLVCGDRSSDRGIRDSDEPRQRSLNLPRAWALRDEYQAPPVVVAKQAPAPEVDWLADEVVDVLREAQEKQESTATALGVSPQHFANVKNGQKPVTVGFVEKVVVAKPTALPLLRSLAKRAGKALGLAVEVVTRPLRLRRAEDVSVAEALRAFDEAARAHGATYHAIRGRAAELLDLEEDALGLVIAQAANQARAGGER